MAQESLCTPEAGRRMREKEHPMTAKTTRQTNSEGFAIKSLLKGAGALAVGAVLCAGSVSWVRADQPADPQTISDVTAPAQPVEAADTISLLPPPLSVGRTYATASADAAQAIPHNAAVTGSASTPPSPTVSTNAQTLTASAAAPGGLTPTLIAALVTSLVGASSTAAPAPQATAAPAPAAAVAAAPAINKPVSVAGSTENSVDEAKIGTTVTGTASCPTGKTLLGGGAAVTTSDSKHDDRAQLSESSATNATTWTAVGVVSDSDLAPGEALSVTATALCD